jgi:hypothetical protein
MRCPTDGTLRSAAPIATASTSTTTITTPTIVQQDSRGQRFRLKILGWSPWGAPVETRIGEDEYNEYKSRLQSLLNNENVANLYIIEDPYAYNFQMLIRLPTVTTSDGAFVAKQKLEKIISENAFVVRSVVPAVKVDASPERKAWYKNFFSTWRALLEECPEQEKGKLREVVRELSVVHTDFRAAVFRLNKKDNTIKWNDTILGVLGVTKEAIDRRLSELS